MAVPLALRRYQEDYLLCRNLGHVWDILGYYRGDGGVVHRRLQCARCGSERTDAWQRDTGERFPSAYRYASDYSSPKGEPFESMDVRLEVIRRADVYRSKDDMDAALTQTAGRRARGA